MCLWYLQKSLDPESPEPLQTHQLMLSRRAHTEEKATPKPGACYSFWTTWAAAWHRPGEGKGNFTILSVTARKNVHICQEPLAETRRWLPFLQVPSLHRWVSCATAKKHQLDPSPGSGLRQWGEQDGNPEFRELSTSMLTVALEFLMLKIMELLCW